MEYYLLVKLGRIKFNVWVDHSSLSNCGHVISWIVMENMGGKSLYDNFNKNVKKDECIDDNFFVG